MTPQALATLMARAYRHQTPWSAGAIAATLDSPAARLLSEDGAFLLWRDLPGEAEILALATDPALQRQGRAAALLARFHATAIAAGATRALLDVAADNSPALALYEGCGYAAIARRPGYFPRPGAASADALLMARDLTRGQA
jgi:ribosomal-protein-alanine N-acetyltransferase